MQSTLDEKYIFDYLDANQQALKKYLKTRVVTLDKLKRGTSCLACGQSMTMRPKYLDDRLVEQLRDIKIYLTRTGRYTFDAKEVWYDLDPKEHARVVADFQKLQYFKVVKDGKGLIESKGSKKWKITGNGERFLNGTLKVAKKVFVMNNKVLDIGEEMVSINDISPRWQEDRQDYSLDYNKVNYKSLFDAEEV